MPAATNNPFVHPIDNATAAVDAYIRRAFPGHPPQEQAARRSDPETLHCLLSDLLHYCDHHNLDFTQLLGHARASYADDLATAQTFVHGDEVQPRADTTWRGIVTGTSTTQHGEVLHTIDIPGDPTTRVLPAQDLTTATPFGPLESGNGLLTTAQQAEGRLRELSLRIRLTEHNGRVPAPSLYAEQRDLAHALAAWSGGSSAVLL
ncbi:hypothetical protein ACFQ07_29055, partial [Actinomadura adrarensis]